MEGWIDWTTADSLPRKWSAANHRSRARPGKSAGQKTDVLNIEPRRQLLADTLNKIVDKKDALLSCGNKTWAFVQRRIVN